jgi:hypothetical protein
VSRRFGFKRHGIGKRQRRGRMDSINVAYYFNYTLPSYNLASARASLARDNWSANLFVDNLTNKVALMTANNTSFQFNIPQVVRYTTNQPRTFRMQVYYRF